MKSPLLTAVALLAGGPVTVAPCARARLTADRKLHRAALKTRREIKFIAHLATEYLLVRYLPELVTRGLRAINYG
jgi:hypothetical protein